jgi:hypothetical protein
MICVRGVVEVHVGDSAERRMFRLDRGNLALLVPPMIWNTVVFQEEQSVVVVLCDRPYEAEDYVNDHAQFVHLRQGATA